MKTLTPVKLVFAFAACLTLSAHPVNAQTTETQSSETRTTSNNSLQLEACHIRGLSEQVECGVLSVPENHDAPNGKQIELNIVRLPAVSSGAANDPLFFLAGGPGQAATELSGLIDRIFQDVRQRRDVVLVDQRGTGKSGPLQCEISALEELLLPDDQIDLVANMAKCAEEFDVDFQQYSTVNAIRDFEMVRKALGYQQINLYGGSYGTRAALVWMREAPAALRSVVLDGVAPTQVVVGPFGSYSQRAFDLMVSDCNNDSACVERFGAIDEKYYALRERLLAEPEFMTMQDARSDETREVLMTAKRLAGILRTALYSPRTRQLIPIVISEANDGNWRPLAGLIGAFDADSPLYTGLLVSVLCQEDMPRVDAELLARDGDNRFIGGSTGEDFVSMCAGWPVQPLPDNRHAEPVVSDIPALLLSGEQDPVTPPEWAEIAAETLSNSQHLVAEFGGHTIMSHTCANRLIAQFLEDPSKAVDASCLARTRMLPFLRNVNAAGM
ncbi:Putative hydrolase or acyltransferase of alpha/beta superfamily [Idiomarina sp. A28L]|uniref:alpha/beta hydrolase n=1 Tax=Idiomarina sp. A28L TaxID=1036674 RepID=UPI000213866E|nr:alpha/beta hydrolase [Idiomarina sp. A28L]EGN74766.1 Putative hydrolase or acyltransferase of alpha/beta superfamily [Idiomarina sp. A28L]